MVQIKQAFASMYGQTLGRFIAVCCFTLVFKGRFFKYLHRIVILCINSVELNRNFFDILLVAMGYGYR